MEESRKTDKRILSSTIIIMVALLCMMGLYGLYKFLDNEPCSSTTTSSISSESMSKKHESAVGRSDRGKIKAKKQASTSYQSVAKVSEDGSKKPFEEEKKQVRTSYFCQEMQASTDNNVATGVSEEKRKMLFEEEMQAKADYREALRKLEEAKEATEQARIEKLEAIHARDQARI